MFPPSLPLPASASQLPFFFFCLVRLFLCPVISSPLARSLFFLTSLLCVYIYLSVCLLVDFLLAFGSFFSVFFYLFIFHPPSPFLYPVCRLSVFPFSLSRFPPSCLPSSLSFPPLSFSLRPIFLTFCRFPLSFSSQPPTHFTSAHSHISPSSFTSSLFFFLLHSVPGSSLHPLHFTFLISSIRVISSSAHLIVLLAYFCRGFFFLSLSEVGLLPLYLILHEFILTLGTRPNAQTAPAFLPHPTTLSLPTTPPPRYSRPHSTASAIQKVSPKMCFGVVSLFLSIFPSSYLYLYFFSWWFNVYLCSHIYLFFPFIFLLLSTHNKVTS